MLCGSVLQGAIGFPGSPGPSGSAGSKVSIELAHSWELRLSLLTFVN